MAGLKTYESAGGWVLGSFWNEGRRGDLHPKQAAPYVAVGLLVEIDAGGLRVFPAAGSAERKVAPEAEAAKPKAPVTGVAPPVLQKSRKATVGVTVDLPSNLTTSVKPSR